MKRNFRGKSLSHFLPLAVGLIGVFILCSGFGPGDLNTPPPGKVGTHEGGKLAHSVVEKEMGTCGGCNPILAAVRDKAVRKALRQAYTPGYKITPVIEFQVGCFEKGCFSRIHFMKSVSCDFPPCYAAPEMVVASVEVSCDCIAERLTTMTH